MLASAALWAWSAAAPAGPGLQLTWEAPDGCPGQAEVRARVVRLVGEEAARSAKLTARGVVSEAGGRWRLALELSGETGGGQRSLTAGKCEELAEAGALVVAIAVDPRAALASEGTADEAGTAGGEVAPGGGATDQGTVPPVGGTVPAPPEGQVDGTGSQGQVGEGSGSRGQVGSGTGSQGQVGGGPKVGPVDGVVEIEDKEVEETGVKGQGEKGRLIVGVRVAAGVAFLKILPRTGAAVSVAVSLGGKRWRAELGGLHALPVTGGTPAIGGTFQLGAVELRGCPTWRRGRFEVPVCLGMQVGAIRGTGRGSGLESTQTAHALWAAGTAGAALSWRPRERIGLWLQADAIVALTRPEFRTAGGVSIHASGRVAGQVLAGVEFRVR